MVGMWYLGSKKDHLSRHKMKVIEVDYLRAGSCNKVFRSSCNIQWEGIIHSFEGEILPESGLLVAPLR